MDIREIIEKNEEKFLSKYAIKSSETRGRKKDIEKCEIRTDFQRDRDRIIHSKAFRRLMYKTQVFILPEGDHYRTRLTHTLEVTQVSRTIARALNLNEDLTEAIALGHDLGHTPFGHIGEDALNNIFETGFRHNEQSVRVAEKLENNGEGLNLTLEVLDGILNHRSRCLTSTLEGKVVQISDKIAYINHDIDDAIRADLLTQEDLPKDCVEILGFTSSKRINYLIKNVIKESANINDILMDEQTKRLMAKLRKYLFDTVYVSDAQILERNNIADMLTKISNYYIEQPQKLPKEFLNMIENGEDTKRTIIDHIACMTDRYAQKEFFKINSLKLK